MAGTNSKKVATGLNRALYVVLGLLFTLFTGMAVNAFLNPDPHFFQHNTNNKVFAASLALLFLALLLIVFLWTRRSRSSQSDNRITAVYCCIILFLLALGVRLAFLVFYGSLVYPFSDFGFAHEAALGSLDWVDRHAMFPAWGFYSAFVQWVYSAIIPNHVVMQVVNAVLAGLSSVLVYLLANRITQRVEISAIAGLFFALYPANILYSAILTPEHPAILLSLTAFLLLSSSRSNKWRFAAICCLVGAVLALLDYFRQMAPVIIVALVVTALLYLLWNRGRENTSDNWKRLTLFAACLLITFFAVGTGLNAYLENRLGRETVSSSYLMSHALLVGLSPSSEGQVHMGEYRGYFLAQIEENPGAYSVAAERASQALATEIRENPRDFAALFPTKFRWAWQDDMIPSTYVWSMMDSETEAQSQLQRIAEYRFPSISQIFYLMLVFFATIGIVAQVRKGFNPTSLFVSVYIFGFFLMLLIIEAQSRYKSILIPFICIFAAMGFAALLQAGQKMIARGSAVKQGD